MDDVSSVLPGGDSDLRPAFDLERRGYDREQVDAHVGYLLDLLAQRDEELATADERMRAANERTDPSYEGLGRRIGEILRLADEEAQEIRERAAQQAQQATAEADSRLGAAEGQSQQIVAGARERADRMVQDAEVAAQRRREQLDAELAELSRRRDEIRAELEALHTRLSTLMGAAATGGDG